MSTMDYRKLYFPDGDGTGGVDIADMFTDKGAMLYIDGELFPAVFDIPDLGETPDGIEATTLYDQKERTKAGREGSATFDIQYRFTKAAYRRIEVLKAQKGSVEIKIVIPGDGAEGDATFENKGKCTTNYLSGITLNNMINAHAVFDISEQWLMADDADVSG